MASSRDQVVGVTLVLISTVAIAMVPTAAKLAVESGSSTLTVVTLRGIIGAVLMAALMAAMGQSYRMSRDAFRHAIIAGLFYTAMSYGLIGSVSHITVSLTVLIYFTHPILLALLAHLRGDDELTFSRLLLVCIILVGLGLVIGSETSRIDLTGVALAAVASVTVCGMILFSAEAQKQASSLQVNVVMTSTTVVLFVLPTTVLWDWSLPETQLGWVGIVITGGSLTIGLLAFFAAFKFIGPVRATVISTLEPLLGVLIAALVLGERLSAIQWFGVVLVIGALIMFEAREKTE